MEEFSETLKIRPQVFTQSNQGKGSAVRTGIRHSHGDVVIIQDADLEYDPQDYFQCIEPILQGKYAAVYGSRQESGKNRLHSSPIFYLGALSLTFCIDLLFHAELTDEPTCYKAFRGDLIRNLPFQGNRFDWECEITAKILRLGFEIYEVPIAYHPRKKKEGKKIRWKDGIQSLWTCLKWKWHPLKDIRASLEQIPDLAKVQKSALKAERAILLLVFAAVAIRLLYSIPGLMNPDLLCRPDSATYLGPAFSLAHDGTFSTGPGSGQAALIRTPGYPLYLAVLLLLSGGSLQFCIIISCILGGLAVLPVYRAARLYANWKVSWISAFLFALNPTAIAYTPMFLSDALFAWIVAFQMLFFLKFMKSGFGYFFFAAVLTSIAGTYIRPINIVWILPCLFVLCFLPKPPFREKIRFGVCALVLTA